MQLSDEVIERVRERVAFKKRKIAPILGIDSLLNHDEYMLLADYGLAPNRIAAFPVPP